MWRGCVKGQVHTIKSLQSNNKKATTTSNTTKTVKKYNCYNKISFKKIIPTADESLQKANLYALHLIAAWRMFAQLIICKTWSQ